MKFMSIAVLFIVCAVALMVPYSAHAGLDEMAKKFKERTERAEEPQASSSPKEEQKEPYFKNMVGKANVLLITGDYSDERTKRQITELKTGIDGLKIRDVAVIRFVRDRIFEMSDFSNFNFHSRFDMNADLQRYIEGAIEGDNNVFSVMVFGKDGQKKMEWVPDEIEGHENDIIPMRDILFAVDSPVPLIEKK